MLGDVLPLVSHISGMSVFDISRLAPTTINRRTLLATDYLNHFNEIVMLLELADEMPDEVAAGLAEWRPASYLAHFSRSRLRDAALAVEAYSHAPEDVREALDAVTRRLDMTILELKGDPADANPSHLAAQRRAGADRLRPLIAAAADIINGEPEVIARFAPARPVRPCESAA